MESRTNSTGKDNPQLTEISAKAILEYLELKSAYLEVFHGVHLKINALAAHLKTRDHGFDPGSKEANNYELRFKYVKARIAQRNQQMIEYNYINTHIVSQQKSFHNPAYALLESEGEYKKAYKKKSVSFTLSFVPTSNPKKSELDRMVDNTEIYLRTAENLIMFLSLIEESLNVEDRMDVNVENQLFQEQFVQPVEQAISNYRKAEGMDSKISAYKQISDPLKNLTTKMYEQAVKIYPDLPKPTYFNPETISQKDADLEGASISKRFGH